MAGALDWIAEQRIARAIAAGELDHLPGEGRPLPDDIDPLIPEEMRVMIRVLRQSGAVPWQVELWRELHALEAEAAAGDAARRQALEQRLLALRMRLEREVPDSVRRIARAIAWRRERAQAAAGATGEAS